MSNGLIIKIDFKKIINDICDALVPHRNYRDKDDRIQHSVKYACLLFFGFLLQNYRSYGCDSAAKDLTIVAKDLTIVASIPALTAVAYDARNIFPILCGYCVTKYLSKFI